MEEFKVGDIVVLKSGGPSMTVEVVGIGTYGVPNMITCRWFSVAYDQLPTGPHRAEFRPEILEAVDEDEDA